MSVVKKEELLQIAVRVEKIAYFPYGRAVDGAPYNCGTEQAQNFLKLALYFFAPDKNDPFSGIDWLEKQVRERRANGEKLADENCGNWWLWTLLNVLEVSRVRK